MGEDSIYKFGQPLTGKVVEERLNRNILLKEQPTTDDINGGEVIWILKCGDSKTNIN